jgi:hypothetical protein
MQQPSLLWQGHSVPIGLFAGCAHAHLHLACVQMADTAGSAESFLAHEARAGTEWLLLLLQGYRKMPIRDIARKLFSYADGCTFSGEHSLQA